MRRPTDERRIRIDTMRRDAHIVSIRIVPNRAVGVAPSAKDQRPEGGGVEHQRPARRNQSEPRDATRRECGPGWCRTDRGTACGCSPTRATHSGGRRIRTDRRERARRSIVDPNENVAPCEPSARQTALEGRAADAGRSKRRDARAFVRDATRTRVDCVRESERMSDYSKSTQEGETTPKVTFVEWRANCHRSFPDDEDRRLFRRVSSISCVKAVVV